MMKRTFLPRRNSLLRDGGITLDAGALALVLLLLVVRLALPNFFWYVFTPIFHTADTLAAGSHRLFSSFGDSAVLSTKNEQLANENAALASQNQMLLKKEEALTALIGTSAKQPGILAGVVARPPESPYDTLLVAAGSVQGAVVGMEAFVAPAVPSGVEGVVPVGTVSSVFNNFSRVTLFSNPGMTTGGWVGQGNVPVTVVGRGAGVMTALVSRSASIVVGDTVFVSGPGALPVGSVARIDSEPSSPSVTLRILPAINLFSITWIVLKDVGESL